MLSVFLLHETQSQCSRLILLKQRKPIYSSSN